MGAGFVNVALIVVVGIVDVDVDVVDVVDVDVDVVVVETMFEVVNTNVEVEFSNKTKSHKQFILVDCKIYQNSMLLLLMSNWQQLLLLILANHNEFRFDNKTLHIERNNCARQSTTTTTHPIDSNHNSTTISVIATAQDQLNDCQTKITTIFCHSKTMSMELFRIISNYALLRMWMC
jgi:hypothetical protein